MALVPLSPRGTHTPWGGFRSLGLRVVPGQHLVRRGADTLPQEAGWEGLPRIWIPPWTGHFPVTVGLGVQARGERSRGPQQQGWIGPASAPNPSFSQAPPGPP